MRFRVAHTFAGVDLPTFEACYFDEAFNEALCAHAKLQRTVVALTRDDARLQRAVQIYPERTLPAPLAKLVGAERFGYTEHVDYVYGSYHVDWHVAPGVLADKLVSRGVVTFADDGQGGVVRVVEGEVNVRLFAVGKTVERFIVADVEKSYAEAAAFMADYLRR